MGPAGVSEHMPREEIAEFLGIDLLEVQKLIEE